MDMFIVDAFVSKHGTNGNPAGVALLEGDFPPESEMQKIAFDMGFSETVFVKPIAKAHYALRYFTPVCEADLCGHATIATFALLESLGKVTAGQNLLASVNVGRIGISVGNGGLVWMDMARPEEIAELSEEQTRRLLQYYALPQDACGMLVPSVVSTGLPDIILPVKNRVMLNSAVQNKEAITELSREMDVTGVHMFALDNGAIFSRNFAPLWGIDEEAATGTANGALTYYLYRRGLIEAGVGNCVTQGEEMGRESNIYTILNVMHDGTAAVRIGGYGRRR